MFTVCHDAIDERDKKGKKGLEYIFLKNLVDLLKLLVAICKRRLYGLCALPCKRLCVENTTFARKRLTAYVYDLFSRGDFMRTMYVLCA